MIANISQIKQPSIHNNCVEINFTYFFFIEFLQYNFFKEEMIIETFLSLQNGKYPFDQTINPRWKTMVQEIEHFSSISQLSTKKAEAERQKKIFQANEYIKLLKIYLQDRCLHYIYEYIPLSLHAFINKQLGKKNEPKIKEMTAKLLFRRVSSDLNTIIANLTKMRVQCELKYENIGVVNDKIKIFIGCKYLIGRKSEVLLKQHYKPLKQTILKELNTQILSYVEPPQQIPNFNIKGNRLVFNINKKDTPIQAVNMSNYTDDYQSSFCMNDTYINCQTRDSNINQARQKQRRYSQTKWQPNQQQGQRPPKQKMRSTQLPAFASNLHFQGRSKMGQSRHQEDESIDMDDSNIDGKSYRHSKSIRIEFQKNKGKKQRKDSYKVKIITCHQYQMEDLNQKDLFEQCNLSQNDSFESNKPQRKHSTNNNFDEKVKKAAEKAKCILDSYLRKRKQSRD